MCSCLRASSVCLSTSLAIRRLPLVEGTFGLSESKVLRLPFFCSRLDSAEADKKTNTLRYTLSRITIESCRKPPCHGFRKGIDSKVAPGIPVYLACFLRAFPRAFLPAFPRAFLLAFSRTFLRACSRAFFFCILSCNFLCFSSCNFSCWVH